MPRENLRSARATAEAMDAPPAQAPVSFRPMILPDKFTSGTWSDYVRYFNTVASFNAWTAEEKLQCLQISLVGESRTIFNSLPEDVKHDFSRCVGELNKKLNPPELHVVKEQSVNDRVQLPGESISSFYNNLVGLFEGVFPMQRDTPVGRSLLREVFLRGLRDPNIRLQVRLGSPATVEAALSTALQAESAYVMERRPAGASTVAALQATSTSGHDGCSQQIADLARSVSTLSENFSALQRTLKGSSGSQRSFRSPRRRPYDRPACWQCGKVGHVQANCQQAGNDKRP